MKIISLVNYITGKIFHFIKNFFYIFPGSKRYWEKRYEFGGNSGTGSYGKLSQFKASTINSFISKNEIESVIEYGCGDGSQIKNINYPKYIGFDISAKAINICKEKYFNDPLKLFKLIEEYSNETADLTVSLDVVYHLIEDQIFKIYMSRLFESSKKFVVIYSSNTDQNSKFQAAHVRHRKFTKWIEANISGWILIDHIPNRFPINSNGNEGSFADFYFYKKCN